MVPTPTPLHPNPPALHKADMWLFKNGYNERDGKFLLEMGVAKNGGIGFIMEGTGNFKSLFM